MHFLFILLLKIKLFWLSIGEKLLNKIIYLRSKQHLVQAPFFPSML